METVTAPILHWIVAGNKGMELWGFDKGWQPDSEPDAKVSIHPLHWDFHFPAHSGSGRVRIGAGCQYNPLQMVEAMFKHITDISDDDENSSVIHIDIDSSEDSGVTVDWNPDAEFKFSSDWE